MTVWQPWRVAAVAAGLLAAAALAGSAETPMPRTHRVEIRQFQFVPDVLAVAPGDTIDWINLDIVPHTVTALDGSWDSQNLDAGAQWSTEVVASMSGAYFCRYHPSMVAVFMIGKAKQTKTASDQVARCADSHVPKSMITGCHGVRRE